MATLTPTAPSSAPGAGAVQAGATAAATADAPQPPSNDAATAWPRTLLDGLAAIAVAFEGIDAEAAVAIAPLAGGLINDTWAVGGGFVLQRLHPIFAASVNDDIAALTPILRAAAVPVPALVRSRDGAASVVRPAQEGGDPRLHGVFRMMTRLPGRCHQRVTSPAMARSAAELLGRFHAALAGSDHAFAFTRPGAHDTDGHVAAVAEALAAHPDHHLAAEVRALYGELAPRWQRRAPRPTLPPRLIHGDPKISNLLFDDEGRAIGLLDLDTMARATLDVELGDALRSWCNRSGEDEPAVLDVDVFAAALEGFASSGRVLAVEAAAIVDGLWRIALELAARFAADALNERYFGWSAAKAPSRGDHNLLRARGQLSLVVAVEAARPRLEAIAAGLAGG